MTSITGQSLPVLMASRMRDVLWGDLDMTHPGEIFEERRFFLSTFPHRLNSKDLSRKRRSFPMKRKSDWKKLTLPRKTSCKKEIKNIGQLSRPSTRSARCSAFRVQ